MLAAMTDFNDFNRRLIEEYRATGGQVSGQFAGPLLLLTTTGVRTGLHHTIPAMYRRDGDRLLVFASNSGAAKHPHWYTNLVAHPKATVEIGTDSYPALAVITDGEERERLFAEAAAQYPVFVEYERRSGRRIPVVALERA
jgi:deazaflavin-dependent oxidoreductase (nitroreductase family)